MLNSLLLRNFRRHTKLDIEFTPGFNGIFGPNYTGKSSIGLAVRYCLGGAGAVRGHSLPTHGDWTGFEQTLDFTLPQGAHRIRRTKTSARLWHEDTLLAEGHSTVTAEVEKLLGVSVNRFVQLRFAEQDKIYNLLTLGAAELNTLLDDLTGVSTIDKALERLKEIRTVTMGQLEVLQEVDLADLLRQRGESKLALDNALTVQEALAPLLAQQEAELTAKEQDLRSLEARAQQAEEYTRELATLTDVVALRQQDAEQAQQVLDRTPQEDDVQLEKQEAELEAARQQHTEISNARREIGLLQVAITKHDAGMETLRKAGLPTLNYRTALETKLDTWEESHRLTGGKLIGLENERDKLQESLEDAVCPTCKRPFEDFDPKALQSQLDEVEATRRDIKKLYDSLTQDIRQGKKELEAAGRAYEDFTRLQSQLAQDRDKLAGLSKLSDSDLPDLAQQQAAITQHRERLGAYNQALSQLKLTGAKWQSAKQSLEEFAANNPAPEVPFPSVIQALREQLPGLRRAAEQARAKQAETATLIDIEQKTVARLDPEIEAAETSNARLGNKRKRLATTNHLMKYVRENRDRYAGATWQAFMEKASAFCAGCTGGRVAGFGRTEAGKFLFEEEGMEQGLIDASGAQKAILGLSIQMALADAANLPLDTLFVDEPTAGMDPEHSLAAPAMLSAGYHQVICISHSEMDAALCDNTIYLERE